MQTSVALTESIIFRKNSNVEKGGFTEGRNGGVPPMRRAAMYVRMSTDHQKYSTENQAEAIQEYAVRHNIEIIETYADQGKSGLSLDGRDALKRLIDDVQASRAAFTVILVLDVTRWGRFQDADESAYYEYICRRAGIEVLYVAEQFENDGSPVSTIVKGVKRAMAGEYSRELSAKVFAGQCRLIELGYRQGGPAGYGLRRMLIDEQGQEKGLLKRGEHKSLQTDRVVLVPGPEEEIETVRWIYRAFVDDRLIESQIATLLNQKGIRTDWDRPWTRGTVHQILTNEKYIGNNVFNRTSFKLKKRRVVNESNMWVRADTIRRIQSMGGTVRREVTNDLLIVNEELKISTVICRCFKTGAGNHRWRLHLDTSLLPDITIAIRMDHENKQPLDYYLLPGIDIENPKIRLADQNSFSLEAYRFDDLEPFFFLTERCALPEAA